VTWIRTRASEASENPLALLRLVAGALLLVATLLALGLALAGLGWRGVELAGALWALYGLIVGGLALLDPTLEGLARALQSAGLMRGGGEYSAIESMVIQGRHEAAIEACLERARHPRDRVEATLRRAAILADGVGDPAAAVQVLLDLRDTASLPPADDVRVGLALAELHERRLGDDGAAMRELRRLIDLHPDARGRSRLAARLARLKE
jgi:hypothetical protein